MAVIAAYRDLPPPIKELIDWDQQRNDVQVKYEQIVTQFSPEHPMPPHRTDNVEPPPPPNATIDITGLTVTGTRGNVLLERSTATIDRPAQVALVGAPGSGRDILAKVLGRQITEYAGTVEIGTAKLSDMSDETASRFLAYVGVEPRLFPGSIRDNVAYSLLRVAPASHVPGTPPSVREWIDYRAAGASGPDELDRAILHALEIGGAGEDIYRFGILGRLNPQADAGMSDRIVDARHVVRERLYAHGYTDLVEPFDPERYNTNATVGENLLFGVPVGDRFSLGGLASDSYARSVLDAEGLTDPLVSMGIRIAEITIETFADLPRGHPLFERYSFVHTEDLELLQRILDTARTLGSRKRLSQDARDRLVALAYSYIEPRHRLALLDDDLRARIVRARTRFKANLPVGSEGSIEFYDPHRFLAAAPILDNLLFGRVDYSVGNADQKVSAVVRETLVELDLLDAIHRLGLDYEVGVGGRLLMPALRTAVDIARCLVRRPEMLVIDGPVGASHEFPADPRRDPDRNVRPHPDGGCAGRRGAFDVRPDPDLRRPATRGGDRPERGTRLRRWQGGCGGRIVNYIRLK